MRGKLLVTMGGDVEQIHGGATFFAIFISGPVVGVTFAAVAGHWGAATAADSYAIFIVGTAMRAEMPFENEFALAGITRD